MKGSLSAVSIVVVILLAGLLNNAWCADWKYFGSGSDSKNKGIIGSGLELSVLFFGSYV